MKLSRQQWNPAFINFANHYGFTAKTHLPYRPRTKGKVKRPVHYVKNNFLAGETFENLDDLNARGLHWLNHTANVRLHATTGKRPVDLFNQHEQSVLKRVDHLPVYRFMEPANRTVTWESMVHFQGSRYSVPPIHAGKKVQVTAQGGQIIVRSDDLIIAEHDTATETGQCIAEPQHMAELWKITQQQTQIPNPTPPWQVTFNQTVEQVPLTCFEEVAV